MKQADLKIWLQMNIEKKNKLLLLFKKKKNIVSINCKSHVRECLHVVSFASVNSRKYFRIKRATVNHRIWATQGAKYPHKQQENTM